MVQRYLRYWPPEVIKDGCFSPATDIWSFGALIWHCFNPGEPQPFDSLTDPEVFFVFLEWIQMEGGCVDIWNNGFKGDLSGNWRLSNLGILRQINFLLESSAVIMHFRNGCIFVTTHQSTVNNNKHKHLGLRRLKPTTAPPPQPKSRPGIFKRPSSTDMRHGKAILDRFLLWKEFVWTSTDALEQRSSMLNFFTAALVIWKFCWDRVPAGKILPRPKISFQENPEV